jgi:AcrR family transcriptional regulator
MKTERRPYRQSARAQAAAATGERILDVATEHFLQRFYDEVTLAKIAKEAGVSQQTILNRFRSKEGLLEAVAERIGPERSRRANTDDPVEGVVGDYEPSGDATIRLIALEERVPALAPFLARGRAGHRAWVEEAFAARLPPPGAPDRERAVALHVVATDISTWKLLRRDMGLSRAATVDAMRTMVDALSGSKA